MKQKVIIDRMGVELIQAHGLKLIEAAEIIRELAECMGTKHKIKAKECIQRLRDAREVLQETDPQLTLERGVEHLLKGKQHRRAATRRELEYYTKKILMCNPELARREMRHISTQMCREMLRKTFQRTSSRSKARTILHGLFSYCCRMGWLQRNPVQPIQEAPSREREKEPLTLEEILRLLRTSLLPKHRACAPAVGIMIWSGMRPTEITRLRWRNIHIKTRTITLYATQSKTGGSRCVSMPQPLLRWLRRLNLNPHEDELICPKGWIKRWGELHRASGLHPWVPDVLRHSFASYHAAHYRDMERLQYEMGHRSSQMLRFRYISASHISRKAARAYWSAKYWDRLLD